MVKVMWTPEHHTHICFFPKVLQLTIATNAINVTN